MSDEPPALPPSPELPPRVQKALDEAESTSQDQTPADMPEDSTESRLQRLEQAMNQVIALMQKQTKAPQQSTGTVDLNALETIFRIVGDVDEMGEKRFRQFRKIETDMAAEMPEAEPQDAETSIVASLLQGAMQSKQEPQSSANLSPIAQVSRDIPRLGEQPAAGPPGLSELAPAALPSVQDYERQRQQGLASFNQKVAELKKKNVKRSEKPKPGRVEQDKKTV